jgi:hypothetical protein
MSSVKADAKSAHRNPEGSSGRVIRGGLGGPKPRPQGVGDGQPVSIPAPPPRVEAPVTSSGNLCAPNGHGAFLQRRAGCGRSGDFGQGDRGGPERARKAWRGAWGRPYRKPTLVGGCERTQVGERTFVKELGNLTP